MRMGIGSQGTQREEACGKPTWISGRHNLWFSIGCLLELGAGIQQECGDGGEEGMVCGIHRGLGTGEERLKLVFCCSTREETRGWFGMKEGVVSLQLLPHPRLVCSQ